MVKRRQSRKRQYRPNNDMRDFMKMTTDVVKVGVVTTMGVGILGAAGSALQIKK